MIKKWQDKVISLIGCLFGFMLIPMIIDSLNGMTINPVSAGLTMAGLYVMAITFWTLKLRLSTVSNLFSATMWAILFVLSLR